MAEKKPLDLKEYVEKAFREQRNGSREKNPFVWQTKHIVLVAVVLIVIMGLFPPWTDMLRIQGRIDTERPTGYAFIFSPPAPTINKQDGSVRIDFGRLLLQWFLVGVVAATAIYLRKERGD
jgi:hypothetical protein